MSNEFAPLPSAVLSDEHLSDGEKITTLRLLELAWAHRKESGKTRTPTMQLGQLAELLDMSRATLYRHVGKIVAREYFDRRESPLGVTFSLRVSRMRLRDTSSSLIEGVSKHEENLKNEDPKKRREFETRFEMLRAAGVGEPVRSRLAADDELSAGQIRDHAEKVRRIGEPVAYLVQRLRSHEPAPMVCDECNGVDDEHELDCPAWRRMYAQELVDAGLDEDGEGVDRLYLEAMKKRDSEETLPPPKDIGEPPDWWVD